MQQPRSFTRFRCWSWEIKMTSFLNSCRPCPEFSASLFTAISCPDSSSPYNHNKKVLINKIAAYRAILGFWKCLNENQPVKLLYFTLYTGPNPPAPILLAAEKLFVAASMVAMSNNGSSRSSLSLSTPLMFAWLSGLLAIYNKTDNLIKIIGLKLPWNATMELAEFFGKFTFVSSHLPNNEPADWSQYDHCWSHRNSHCNYYSPLLLTSISTCL